MNAFPNPANEYVSIEVDNPEGKNISAALFDATGKPVDILFDGPANYPGKASLTFAMHTLPPGQYVVKVLLGQQEAVSRSIVKL